MSGGSHASKGTQFSSKLSAVLVAAGCSVGLGNIWRFPYVAGENGGGAFVLIYLACIIIIGLPVMISEFSIGRATRQSAVGAYRSLAGKGWSMLGYNGVLTAFIIMGFYYVVAGWTAEYFVISTTGQLSQYSQPSEYAEIFTNFISHPWKPVVYTWGFIMLNHLIIELGVAKGLERVSNVLMPVLFLILIALCINSLLMPHAMEGVKFFLYPDFSKITPEVVLQAVGQAFFSLSIGLGALIAYGAYIPKESSLRGTAMQVMMLDTSVAVMAGLIIFPAATSVGIDPGSGPALVFQTLPAIFNQLPMGMVWSSIFFLLLVIAALTSTMSLHEVVTVYLIEEWHLSRRVGTYITSASIFVTSAIASLSLGAWSDFKIAGLTLFDAMDYLTANIMLPIGGLLTCIYVGWFFDKKLFENEITNNGHMKCSYFEAMHLLIKYICPLVLFAIFMDSIGII